MGITIGLPPLANHRGVHLPENWLDTRSAYLGMCNLQGQPRAHVGSDSTACTINTPTTNPIRTRPLGEFPFGATWDGSFCRPPRFGPERSRYERYVRDLLRDSVLPQTRTQGRRFFVFLAQRALRCRRSGRESDLAISGGDWSIAVCSHLPELDGIGAGRCPKPCSVFCTEPWSVNYSGTCSDIAITKPAIHSTNNWLVALISHGDGLAQQSPRRPRAARHGHKLVRVRFCHGRDPIFRNDRFGQKNVTNVPKRSSVAGKTRWR